MAEKVSRYSGIITTELIAMMILKTILCLGNIHSI